MIAGSSMNARRLRVSSKTGAPELFGIATQRINDSTLENMKCIKEMSININTEQVTSAWKSKAEQINKILGLT